MNKSESITALAAALTKAQAQMSGAKKSASNPFFKSKYATPSEEVIHCVKEPFADNGFVLCAIPRHESRRGDSALRLLSCTNQGSGSATNLPSAAPRTIPRATARQ